MKPNQKKVQLICKNKQSKRVLTLAITEVVCKQQLVDTASLLQAKNESLLLIKSHNQLQTLLDLSSLKKYWVIGFSAEGIIEGAGVANATTSSPFQVMHLSPLILITPKQSDLEVNSIVSIKR